MNEPVTVLQVVLIAVVSTLAIVAMWIVAWFIGKWAATVYLLGEKRRRG